MPALNRFARHSLIAALICSAFSPFAASAALSSSFVWTYDHTLSGVLGLSSEIPAFDASTNTLWVAGVKGVDVLSAGNGSLLQHIDTSSWGNINSVAIHNGVAAFAIENSTDRTLPGVVTLFDTSSRSLLAGTNQYSVGALPDMLTFTPDGTRLLVANEATPTVYGNPALDPAGSVSIINLVNGNVSTAGFSGVAQSGSNIRSNTGMDFEPEYIAVNAAGTKAYVTLQEANAIGILDLASNSFTEVVGLGVKDFSAAGNAIDPNHKDSSISLRSANVVGLYQPDSIATYQVGGQTLLVMANEGDTREDDGDKARAKDTALTGYDADLKQLNISTTDSTNSQLVTFGARSFSIRDTAGNIMFDSGNQLDAEAIARGIYDESRSDDKGVEPEGVALKEIDGRTYAFIGLERTTQGAVAVYDITDPANASFIDMIITGGDVAPEGLSVFSMNGSNYLAIANEGSNTTSLYALNVSAVPEPASWAMLLGGLGLLGFMRRKSQA